MTLKQADTLQNYLYLFLGIIALLVMWGLIAIYSSSSVYALAKYGDAAFYVKKQLIGCIIGLIGLSIIQFFPPRFISYMTPALFIGSWIVTLFTLIPHIGQSIHGSNRWIFIGPISFQPSELLKVTFIMYMAYLLSKKQSKITSLWQSFLPLLSILGITAIVLLKQPDFGQTVTLCITAFLLFFVAHCKMKHLLITASSLIPVAGLLIYLSPYRFMRILNYLDPWHDPQGSGFQIIQSLIAIGSGQLTGVGLAQSKQKFFYLPMQHTDFIFSIIAEETGFIGCMIILLCFMLFLYCGICIALSFDDLFASYTTLGFTFLITIQALINFAVTTGVAPTKGLGLPFLSYGNSALMCNIAFLGVIISFVNYYRQTISSTHR